MSEHGPGTGTRYDADDRAERCATQARLRGDPMLGTAFPSSRLLLVEQPGPWGRAGLLDSRFDRAVAHRLIARLDPERIRVIAIRRPGRSTVAGPRRWAVVDCRPGRERLHWGRFQDDSELLGIDPAAILNGGPVPGSSDPGDATVGDDPAPLFAVCAHGTHDVCCALRGRPVAAALAEARPGRVWECSHVGGDRFAANVLVLSSGLLYGRVVESAAAALADAADGGTVLEHLVRGRVGFAPEVQAAMAHAHRERPGLAVSGVRPAGLVRRSPQLTIVRLDVAGDLVDVAVRVTQSTTQWLTCQAVKPAHANVYQPVSFDRVASGAGNG